MIRTEMSHGALHLEAVLIKHLGIIENWISSWTFPGVMTPNATWDVSFTPLFLFLESLSAQLSDSLKSELYKKMG